ncbi:hypothetical protein [Mycobacteroides abscessus]|uniref:hypothetical protein n=1 Tax=Mycobacteroides abscessus TaxID=36809 RepID=UPI00092749BD|nr:hypothetical protein [Mycobacteroides abscessus]MDO3096815.1 hypothetical protein [Mycobacteroides abscessus subsp. abscessus]SHY09783.1 Uncharacterised protein [Mycobacteroides abscessus subsp. abscessus]SID56832.1 Uncharacterised protein [Mycobacteroides abscessus subsp. abscessus]SIN12964.1 Uncharacterised protein [Mycobacteroides abscessus subsp. abscessus]SKO42949.1 Uncharacterised protein [Mycobacteroides abscessus subsp. abscessus]
MADERGMYMKYRVERMDGKDLGPWFILEYKKDRHARAALAAYADSCAEDNPELAQDLRWTLEELER